MRDNYIKLIDLNFGKYTYTVMKNNDNVLYFEVVNNKYVQPISSFSLYDNEGKSLTNVNQHFFMNQLINRINVACKKGIFISDQEIVEYLNTIKSSCDDPELKKLFKGSYMNEINEVYFEQNKRSILKYLDKFKYDTFVDYNNVSVFSGSLEKNSTAPIEPVVPVEPVASIEPAVSVEPVVENVDIQTSFVENNIVENVEPSVEETDVIDVDDNASNMSISNDQQPENVGLDFTNIPVEESKGDVVSSSDYFSNLQSDNNQSTDVEVIDDVPSGPTVDVSPAPVESINPVGVEVPTAPVEPVNPVGVEVPTAPVEPVSPVGVEVPTAPVESINPMGVEVPTAPVEPVNPVGVEVPAAPVEPVNPIGVEVPTASVEPVNPTINDGVASQEDAAPVDFSAIYGNLSETPQVNNTQKNSNDIQVIQPILGEGTGNSFQGNSFSNDGFSMAEPLIENSTVSNGDNMLMEQLNVPDYSNDINERNAFNTELSVMNQGVTEADLEKTVVTDKVNMPPLENVTEQTGKKNKGKKSFGVIIFIIFLLLALAGFAYFLYNYVF